MAVWSIKILLSDFRSCSNFNVPRKYQPGRGIKENYCPELTSTLWKVTVWLNGWVFVYELSTCVFESSCSHFNVTIFRVFLVRIFPHSDWIQRDTEHLFVFSKNAGKYGPEKAPNTDYAHAVLSAATNLLITTTWIGINIRTSKSSKS